MRQISISKGTLSQIGISQINPEMRSQEMGTVDEFMSTFDLGQIKF